MPVYSRKEYADSRETSWMRCLFNPENTTEFLITTAMTTKHYERWVANSLPSWTKYAETHGLGIICFRSDLSDPNSPSHKNGSWQKLLAPSAAKAVAPRLRRACLLDSDVLISEFADNIFDEAPPGRFHVVSILNGLPYPKDQILRRIAYLRHTYYSKDYPLDSSLFRNPVEEFKDLLNPPPTPSDYFCAGVIVLDARHATLMTEWFNSIEGEVNPDNWEQTHLNGWIQAEKHSWLPYKWQAIWNYEMAWHYPFLYTLGNTPSEHQVASQCVSASLWNNSFLHFAGSWYESESWNTASKNISELDQHIKPFMSYLDRKVSGAKVGKIVPGSDQLEGPSVSDRND